MNSEIQNDGRVNNSISADKTLGVLEILQKIKQTGSGTVSYVFNTKRLVNIHAKKEDKDFGVERNHVYMINAPVNTSIFVKRSITEVLQIFKETCSDMRATYFVLS